MAKKKPTPKKPSVPKVENAERKRQYATKLLEKLVRHTTRELKNQKLFVDD
jgi:hypothetical protein